MGGHGSGRWNWHTKATTVEECRHIDAGRWMREGILAPDLRRWGGWVWKHGYTGEQTASIGYEVNSTTAYPWVRLFYTITPTGGEPQHYDYRIALTTTQPHYGGLRWWWICPLVKDGRRCGRRVGKIYLPPGGQYFGCRHCYALTYESCQESHKYDGLWRRMGFDPAVGRLLESRLLDRRLERLARGYKGRV